MQLISKCNERFRFFLCVTNIFRKYAWFVSLKDEKCIAITNAHQKILDESNRKPNKIWIDRGSEFYNESMKWSFQDNHTEIYLTHNQGKSVVAEIFIRTLKNKINKHMTSVTKNMYIDKLDDVVN